MHFYKQVLIGLLIILSANNSFATHYYGLDLFYTHVSGNTYRLTMVTYGDCSGGAFPSFDTTRPQILIMKGNTVVVSDFLDPEPPIKGIEVTPVCPAELNNTTCKSPPGTVPGVKKFVHSKEFTLSGSAPDWKFVFRGQTDGTTAAGRSNSLTNVDPPGVITLEATLDNSQHANSSPKYTTIATPFYCVNRQVNFNPGAVDADGDSLVYELVPGFDSNTFVTYLPGFSGSKPLMVAPGAFSFSSSTGQLSFTPNNTQRSLVVYKVSEYRNGKLLGTSMREMTVVVMVCSNNPPRGAVSSAMGSTIVDSVVVRTCYGNKELAFDINPVDIDDGNGITMEVNGLPKDSRLDISSNGTERPKSRFTWSMPDVQKGDYTFFVTYTDDGCPIASKQTQAYTIRITSDSLSSGTIAAPCLGRGYIKVMSPPGWSPWSYEIYQGSARVTSRGNITGTTGTDSLAPGKYRVQALNHFGCIAETTAEVPYLCYQADMPNAFSPNGDGNNDILSVIGENVQDIHLRIYNRWGQLVFETRDIKKGWDGKYKGADAPMEAYGYVLSITFKNGEGFQRIGNITLIR